MSTYVEELTTHAVELHTSGRYDEAKSVYSQILSIEPSHVVALSNLGNICFTRKDYQGALRIYASALRIDPTYERALYNLARTYQQLGDVEQAVAGYNACLKQQPRHTDSLENLASILFSLGRYDECLDIAKRRIRIGRDYWSLVIHGHCKVETGHYKYGHESYRNALNLSPARPDLVYHSATADLREGNFSEGWLNMQQRWCTDEFLRANSPPTIPLRKWDGESLTNKRIVIYSEQGIGDEVMFASCIPDVQRLADRVILSCDSRLVDTYRRSFANVDPIPKLPDGPAESQVDWTECDYACSIADLPLFFRPTTDSYPGNHWLQADPDLRQNWSTWQQKYSGLKVGISWSGGSRPRLRLALSQLAQAFNDVEATLVSLQHGPGPAERNEVRSESRNPVIIPENLDCSGDLASLFALIQSLDLVVTIDNAIAHFAGALGTPVWLLLPVGSDWRWMLGGTESHWYGSMRLFRNQTHKNWNAVLKRVSKELIRFRPQGVNPSMPTAPSGYSVRKVITESTTHGDKILLLNDTLNWYHWGCSCTSLALYRAMLTKGHQVQSYPIADIYKTQIFPRSAEQFDNAELLHAFLSQYPRPIELMDSCDRIIINGEGSIHNTNKTALVLLYLAYVAKQVLRKEVQIINHSCFPDDLARPEDPAKLAIYEKVYRCVDFVAVRDQYSYQICKSMGVAPTLSFDCLPLAIRDIFSDIESSEKEDVITIGASALSDDEYLSFIRRLLTHKESAKDYRFDVIVGARAYLANDDVVFVEKLASLYPARFNVQRCYNEAQWLRQIARSRLLISGRFHHSIAAACLATPFLMFATNTPKNEALVERLGDYQGSLLHSNSDPLTVVADALADPDKFLVPRHVIEELQSAAERNFIGLD
jgi:tetratricopeptide (TPR) repeat protein/polysaccharide pyruvyl transferase WcaK-like protein|tara:strand:- start:6658 stop:9300 length:2643 start_codon:yes stop_codon:yes gene_type:complete